MYAIQRMPPCPAVCFLECFSSSTHTLTSEQQIVLPVHLWWRIQPKERPEQDATAKAEGLASVLETSVKTVATSRDVTELAAATLEAAFGLVLSAGALGLAHWLLKEMSTGMHQSENVAMLAAALGEVLGGPAGLV
jgi:hypothetical protein